MASQRYIIYVYYDTPQILALIQPPAPISNCFIGKSLKNFRCRSQLGNKDSRYSFKQNISNFPNFLQYNFIKDEMFKEETFTSKNTAKFMDFTLPKCASSGFFFVNQNLHSKNFNSNRVP